MPGRDRIVDPITKDYLSDGAGGRQYTWDARTAIYHQLCGRYGKWPGDPSAGSRFFELARGKNPVTSPQVIRDIVTEALQPLVDEGRITEPVFEQERSSSRVLTSITVQDLQSGETLDVAGLLPITI